MTCSSILFPSIDINSLNMQLDDSPPRSSARSSRFSCNVPMVHQLLYCIPDVNKFLLGDFVDAAN